MHVIISVVRSSGEELEKNDLGNEFFLILQRADFMKKNTTPLLQYQKRRNCNEGVLWFPFEIHYIVTWWASMGQLQELRPATH